MTFNLTNITKTICNYIGEESKQKFAETMVDTFIMSRIKIFAKMAKYFVPEEKYIETSWKNMVSLHYINTSYKIKNEVIRIHLFTEKKAESECYLGYFNIRPINELCMVLSYIVPNWDVLKMDVGKKDNYIMLYENYVHLKGNEFKIKTFPFFAQDGIVASCVHANIIMLTHYLNKTYEYKKIILSEIQSDYSIQKTKCYPAVGLVPDQITEIFNRNRIPIKIHYYNKTSKNFEKIITTYIESGIPVIMGLLEHVVLIIGHTLNSKGVYNYIVYDDSGVIVSKINNGNISFVSEISWESIKKIFDEDDNELNFIAAPEHERVYMEYSSVAKYFEQHLENSDFFNLISKILPKLELSKRILLVDNSKIKEFLRKNIIMLKDRKYLREYESFCNACLPHYVWYCEIIIDGMILIFLADPTYHPFSIETNIFYNYLPFFSENRLSINNKV